MPDAPPPAPAVPSWRRWVPAALALAVLAALAWLAWTHADEVRQSWAVVRGFPPGLVAAALAAQAVSYLGLGWVYRASAALAGATVSLGRGVLLALAAATTGAVGGGAVGGGAAVFRWLRRDGATRSAAVLVGAAPTLLNAVAIAAASAVGIVALLPLGRLAPEVVAGLVAALAALAAATWGAVWMVGNPGRVGRAASRLARPLGRFWPRAPARVGDGARRVTETALVLRRGWRQPLAGEAVNVAADAVSLACLFAAAGHPVSAAVFVAGYALPLLVTKLSVVPGGLGVVEGGMSGLFALLGVPLPVAVAVVLAYRAVSFWLPVALGLGAAAALERASSGGAAGAGRRARAAPSGPAPVSPDGVRP